jgi:hypothetical protein
MANAMSEENAVQAANQAFYQALSAGSIEGISAACAHDSDVTALHETSTEVAVGWQAVLDSLEGRAVRVIRGIVLCDDEPGHQGPRNDRAGGGP